MRRKKIGTMDFHGSVDITDPCYNRDVWCRMTDVKIRNGVYTESDQRIIQQRFICESKECKQNQEPTRRVSGRQRFLWISVRS